MEGVCVDNKGIKGVFAVMTNGGVVNVYNQTSKGQWRCKTNGQQMLRKGIYRHQRSGALKTLVAIGGVFFIKRMEEVKQ